MAAKARDQEASSRSFVLDLLLTWLASTSEKSKQLAAALVLFELVQLHRHRVLMMEKSKACLEEEEEHRAHVSLVGSTSSAFVQELLQLVRQGSVAASGMSTSPRLHASGSC